MPNKPIKVKTFRAASMPHALAKVKQGIGANAVIVHTRTFKQGGILGIGQQMVVEITARPPQDERFDSRRRQTGSNRLRRMYDQTLPAAHAGSRQTRESDSPRKMIPENPPIVETLSEDIKSEIGTIKSLVENLVKQQRNRHSDNMPEPLFEMYLNLIQQEVADEIAREMLGHVQKNLTGDQLNCAHLIDEKLIEVMEGLISTTGPITSNITEQPRTVALIGPTGVGKTTTIAKLAANFKLRQNKKVGLITIDTYRIGAVDQLRMYAQIIDVPLKVVLTPAQLKEEILLMQDMDVIFIDTAGRCQNDELKVKELQTFLEAADPDETHLVLSTTGHQTHMLSAAEKFKKLGVDRIIFTKLDEAISFGVVFSVLQKVDASLSYITTGQDVPDDIEIGCGRKLAEMLLGDERKDHRVSSVSQKAMS